MKDEVGVVEWRGTRGTGRMPQDAIFLPTPGPLRQRTLLEVFAAPILLDVGPSQGRGASDGTIDKALHQVVKLRWAWKHLLFFEICISVPVICEGQRLRRARWQRRKSVFRILVKSLRAKLAPVGEEIT
jgi:hypothetical protein